jgi:hypothetical protein
MKGIIFTEFLEHIEMKHGIGFVQKIINNSDLPNMGAYTSVGTYDHKDLFRLMKEIHKLKGVDQEILMDEFGNLFFNKLKSLFPMYMKKDGLFNFLDSIENYIHPEVKKMYPEAELPSFITNIKSPTEMIFNYNSKRKMAHFAIGLIKGAAEYFGENVEIEIITFEKEGEIVQLLITRI